MPNIREEINKEKAGKYPEPKLSPANQRKLDETNRNLAKLTEEQLDLLYGRTKLKQ